MNYVVPSASAQRQSAAFLEPWSLRLFGKSFQFQDIAVITYIVYKIYSADLCRFTACSQRLDMHETMRRRGSAHFLELFFGPV